MDNNGLILFDIDGVIRDVSNSYNLATKKTVAKYCFWQPDSSDIDLMKHEGIWNNDWDLSLELIKRRIKKKNLNIQAPLRKDLINSFNYFYFGCKPNEDFNNWSGFIKNEEILVEKNLFIELTKNKIRWGFVSGAEPESAKYVLERRLRLLSPPLIAMHDAPDKPNPKGFIYLANKLNENGLGQSSPPVAYIGDTIADIKTVINARKQIPNQKFISIGVIPPHLHSESLEKDRIEYTAKLKQAGADLILNSVNDLKNIYLDLFNKNY